MAPRTRSSFMIPILLLGLLTLPLMACSLGASSESAKPATVKVGNIDIIPDSAVYIAEKKGYFEQQKITLDFTKFTTGGDMVASLATGDMDVGLGSSSGGLFNAIQRDIAIKIVADFGHLPAGAGTTFFVVRKDLVDSGQFKNLADLKGKKVAIVAPGTGTQIDLSKILEKANLSFKDIEMVILPFPDMLAAFGKKSIDAAVSVEPLATIGVLQGLQVKWAPAGDFYPNQQIGTVMYSSKFAKDPDAGNRFMVAFLQGVRDYTDAFFKNKGKDEVISIMTEKSPVKDAAMFDKIAPEVFNPDGYLNADSIKADYEWYKANGIVKQDVDLSTVIDNKYVDFAVGKLGKYK